MKGFGRIESEGTAGYASARIGLRAPRVAVRIDVSVHWESQFALAMWMASSRWGGAGFIYVPYADGAIHPAIARILHAYDPDYLVDIQVTIGDLEAMNPGWLASRLSISVGAPDYAETVRTNEGQAVAYEATNDVGALSCGPYYAPSEGDERYRKIQLLTVGEGGALPTVAQVLGTTQQPTFHIPDDVDPFLQLALAMRAGFGRKPSVPLGRSVGSESDEPRTDLPAHLLRYSLAFEQGERRSADRQLGGLATAWDLTNTGLVPIGRVRPRTRPIAVIGSGPEDLALAVALDRMFGAVVWLPREWMSDPKLQSTVAHACTRLTDTARETGHPPFVTSLSVSTDALRDLVRDNWPKPMGWYLNAHESAIPPAGEQPEVIAPHRIDVASPVHLACAGDYDRVVTLPTRSDGVGGFEFVVELPPQTPTAPMLQHPNRPFWEVDVEVEEPATPRGRDIKGSSFLAEPERYLATVIRSGRDGVSFNPSSVWFVPSGANLTQSIATPRLRALGLRGWIDALVSQRQPDVTVQLSEAGRRAMIATRLWGSRSAVAEDRSTRSCGSFGP